MQPHTIDLSTRRLWRINTEFAGFIPQILVLGSIMILVYSQHIFSRPLVSYNVVVEQKINSEV